MAHRAVVAFAAPEFEGDDFVIFELIDNGGLDRCTFNKWCANVEFGSVRHEKDFGDFKGRSGFDVEFLDLYLVAGFDAVLFPACLDDCVCHKFFLLNKG